MPIGRRLFRKMLAFACFMVQWARIFPVCMLRLHDGVRSERCAVGQRLAVRELVELPLRELVRSGLQGLSSGASYRRRPQLCDSESLCFEKEM